MNSKGSNNILSKMLSNSKKNINDLVSLVDDAVVEEKTIRGQTVINGQTSFEVVYQFVVIPNKAITEGTVDVLLNVVFDKFFDLLTQELKHIENQAYCKRVIQTTNASVHKNTLEYLDEFAQMKLGTNYVVSLVTEYTAKNFKMFQARLSEVDQSGKICYTLFQDMYPVQQSS